MQLNFLAFGRIISIVTLYLTETHKISDADVFDFVKQSVTMENVLVNVS
jgi:hypothetical protein